MRILWNRATPRALACGALLMVASCAGEAKPEGAAAESMPAESMPAASMHGQASTPAPAASVDGHEGHDHAAEAGHEAEAMRRAGSAGAPTPEDVIMSDSNTGRGLDELELGFDLGSIKIDLGNAGEQASVVPGAVPGLLKPSLVTTRGGMRLTRGESAVHDFGDVREGESYTKNFKFVSDGEAPLVVKTIKPSCGCTKSEIELTNSDGSGTPYELGQAIPLGQKFQLLTEITTDGKHGHTEVTVMMTSNDPKGQTGIKLTADVEKVLELDPPNLMVLIEEMTVLQQRTHDLKVHATRGERFKLALGSEIVLPESIKVDFIPVEPDADGRASVWDVHMTMGPGLDEGRRNYPIYLASDMEIPAPKYPNPDGTPKYFTAIFSAQVNVIGLVSASPSFLGFGIVQPGQEVTRTVEIRCADDFELNMKPEVRILGLYDDNAQHGDAYDISFEPLEGENGMRMNVRLKGMPEDMKSSFGGRILVDIGHPGKEELTIKFSGICRASLPGQK